MERMVSENERSLGISRAGRVSKIHDELKVLSSYKHFLFSRTRERMLIVISTFYLLFR